MGGLISWSARRRSSNLPKMSDGARAILRETKLDALNSELSAYNGGMPLPVDAVLREWRSAAATAVGFERA